MLGNHRVVFRSKRYCQAKMVVKQLPNSTMPAPPTQAGRKKSIKHSISMIYEWHMDRKPALWSGIPRPSKRCLRPKEKPATARARAVRACVGLCIADRTGPRKVIELFDAACNNRVPKGSVGMFRRPIDQGSVRVLGLKLSCPGSASLCQVWPQPSLRYRGPPIPRQC